MTNLEHVNILRPVLSRMWSDLWDAVEERVGAVLGKVGRRNKMPFYTVTEFIPAENIHHDPANNFAVGQAQLADLGRRASRLNLTLLGLAHNHPYPAEPQPSKRDLQLCPARFPVMLMLDSRTFRVWHYDREFGIRGNMRTRPPGWVLFARAWADALERKNEL